MPQDAFDRLRVSQPETIFDSKQLYDKAPLIWEETVGGSGTGTFVSADACTSMAVTANVSDFVIRQTKMRFNYQPGKSQLILMTALMTAQTGVTKRVGAFSGTGANNATPNNGIYFEVAAGVVTWNICKNGVVTETARQANWNIDKFDGNGLSSEKLELSAAQILVIDYEWLGVGTVRVGFFIDGIARYAHTFQHSDVVGFPSVYMSVPNLPLRYQLISTGSAGSMSHICAAVMSEGGNQYAGIIRSQNTGTAGVTTGADTSTYAMVGIRLKYADATIIPTSFSIIPATTAIFKWSIILNPTVAGTFTYSDVTNSNVQSATGATTNTVTGGTLLTSGFSSAGGQTEEIESALRIGSTMAGVMDTLVLCCQNVAASAITYHGALNWREV